MRAAKAHGLPLLVGLSLLLGWCMVVVAVLVLLLCWCWCSCRHCHARGDVGVGIVTSCWC